MNRLPFFHNAGGSSKVARSNEGRLGNKLLRRTALVAIFFFSVYLLSKVFSPNDLIPTGLRYHKSIDTLHNPDRTPKPNAKFVILVRERELASLLPSIRDLQWAFNDDLKNGYDYVILSEEPFTDYFKHSVVDFLSKRPTKPKVQFGLVFKEDWDVPADIDLEKAKKKWERLKSSGRIPYAGSQSYRQMCRYQSGPIFHHPLVKDLEYYWRIEPETKHLCTMQSFWSQTENGKRDWVERDPFRYMRDNGKKYAWNIAMKEYRGTALTLMRHVNVWRNENPGFIEKDNAYSFVSDDGIGYNFCHFWTNFEIIDLSFVKSQAYTSLFEHLDKAGGFFYERWGDAPIRSIAASMLLKKDEIWKVEHAGYYHPPFQYCPRILDPGQTCACDADWNADYDRGTATCQIKYDKIHGIDSRAKISAINAAHEISESFGEHDEPYVIKPPRLATG